MKTLTARVSPGLWALAGNGAFAAAQLCVLAALGVFGGLRELGLYSTALAITAPIQLGLTMNLRSVRVVRDPDEFRMGDILLWTSLAGVCAVVCSTAVGVALFGTELSAVIVAVAVMKAADAGCDVVYGESQRNGRMDHVSLSQMARSFVMVGAAVAVLAPGGSASLYAWVMAFFTVVFVITVQLPVARRTTSAPWRGRGLSGLWSLLRVTWPLGLSAGLTSLNGSLPRIVAFPLLGAEAAGVLALISYPATVMALLGNSLGQAILKPMKDAWLRGGHAATSRIARRPKLVIVGATVLGCITIVVLSVAVESLDGDVLYATYLYLLAAAAAALAAIAYYQLTSAGRFTAHPVLSGAITVIALPLLWVGATEFGLAGTGAAVLIYTVIQYFMWIAVSMCYSNPGRHRSATN